MSLGILPAANSVVAALQAKARLRLALLHSGPSRHPPAARAAVTIGVQLEKVTHASLSTYLGGLGAGAGCVHEESVLARF